MSAAAAVAGLPKPYYDEDGVTVYQGGCRELLPAIGSFDAIITDPVWPKASKLLKGSADPYRLWAEFCALLGPGQASRMVVQLGCLSDPRFLAPIPEWLTFFRVCWLSYVVPSFRGRAVNGADVAYVFGNPPRTFPNGRTLAPGCQMARPNRADFNRSLGANRSQKTYYENQERMDHPAARRLSHVLFLALWYGGESVVDPFGGTGTTGLACKQLNIPCTLIEIEERYCEIAAKRLSQRVLDFSPAAPAPCSRQEVLEHP